MRKPDSDIMAVLRKSSVRPIDKEVAETNKVMATAHLRQPGNPIERALIKMLSQVRQTSFINFMATLISLEIVAGLVISACTVIALGVMLVCPIVGTPVHWPTFILLGKICGGSLGAFLLGAGTVSCIVRLDQLTVVDWLRKTVTTESPELPDEVRAQLVEIDFHVRNSKLEGFRYELEYPSCKKVPDPLLYIVQELPGKPKDEQCVAIWT